MKKKSIGVTPEVSAKRASEMKSMRDDLMKHADDLHVRVMRGNNKTGKNCWTVSLIPVIDCPNCSLCKDTCYDIGHVCWRDSVQKVRANNSAVHKDNIQRYWNEISEEIKLHKVKQLRINVGGDLKYEDYSYVNKCADDNPDTDILFFTKNIADVNKFLDDGNSFRSNVKIIVSRWDGDTVDNKYNFPESHLLWYPGEYDEAMKALGANGNDVNALAKTSHVSGKKFELCSGNCSVCHEKGCGCWNASKGSDIILIAH